MREEKLLSNNNKPSCQVGQPRRIKKADWRYVPYIPELIDAIHNHNPEDKIISKLDGDYTTPPCDFDYHDVLSSYLTEKEAKTVDLYLSEGMTFQEIGDQLLCSRQYAHQLFKTALSKLKPILKGLQLEKQKPLDNKIELNLFLRRTYKE